MNLKTTLLMAAFGLIMSAYSVQTTHAQVVTVQAAKATSTPISSLPCNIFSSGTYALTRNLNYPVGQSVPAIVIPSNLTGAVVVDLKGFTIAGGGDGFGVRIGSYDAPATNAFPITIRNGTVTNFTIGIDASLGGHDGLTNITLDHLTITNPLGVGSGQTTAIYLPTTASTVSYCNLRSYEFGIRTNRTGSVANNSYKNNTFALVDSPFFFENNDFINTDPIVLDIQTVTEHLQFPH
jgi:hypothetical protein